MNDIVRPPRGTEHCRHYSYEPGLNGGPRCAAGVDMSAPGSSRPCMPNPTEGCAKREDYTAAERDEWKRFVAGRLARLSMVMAVIPGSSADRRRKAHWGKAGTVLCPACGNGTVHWSRSSYNGHVRAACTTPDCFEVIE